MGLTFLSLPLYHQMALGKALKLSLAIFPALGRQPGLSPMCFLGWEGRVVRGYQAAGTRAFPAGS